jgi:hypothetical protein
MGWLVEFVENEKIFLNEFDGIFFVSTMDKCVLVRIVEI